MADTCEYGTQKDSIIKDAFPLGVKDDKLRENYLKEDGLTLERAIQISRANENAGEQAAVTLSQNKLEVIKVYQVEEK